MKNTAYFSTRATLRSALSLAAALFLTPFEHVSAAPAQVWHKRGGFEVQLSLYLGGWGATGPLYMWIEYVPNTVFQDRGDDTIWIHDCDNFAKITIGTGEDTKAPPTTVLYSGTCSIVLAGLWQLDPATGWFLPGEKRMNWHIMGSLVDNEGTPWDLFWQFVNRDGDWIENYSFEPAGN